jgi:flagellar M-ring protein FliF
MQMIVKIKESWNKVPFIAKMFLYGIIVAAVILSLVFLFSPDKYKILYTGLETEDSLEIQQYLSTKGIDYKLNEDSTSIMIDGDVILVKRDLALQNLPQGGNAGGLAKFDELSIGSTKSDKEIQYQNRLQEDLQNSIVKAFEGITSANVKLPIIEEKSIFKDEEQEIKMSVAVKTKNGVELSPENVRAIQVFVASSIQEVKTENVEVVDSKMNVLSAVGEDSSFGNSSGNQSKILNETKKQIEEQLVRSLNEVYGKVEVIASVDINFDEIVQNIEKYDPEGTLISTESGTEDKTETNTKVNDTAGTDQNGEVPKYEIEDLNANDVRYAENKENLIENFVVGKTVEKIIKHPELRNVNVAVWVDTDLGVAEIVELEEMIAISSGLVGQAERVVNDKAVYDNGSVKVTQRSFVKIDEEKPVASENQGFEMKWWYWAIIGAVFLILILTIIALIFGRKRKQEMMILTNQIEPTISLEKETKADIVPELDEDKFNFEWTSQQAHLRNSTNEVSKKFPKETADVIKKMLRNND